MDDLRILRERQASAAELADASRGARAPFGSAALLCQTVSVSSYPTTAASFFGVVPAEIAGDEVEGASATYTQTTAVPFFALNLGTSVPPVGNTIIVHAVGGRWVFRFD